MQECRFGNSRSHRLFYNSLYLLFADCLQTTYAQEIKKGERANLGVGVTKQKSNDVRSFNL
jgi:hypothetical protein